MDSEVWPFPEEPAERVEGTELARIFGRCFAGSDGERVLAHLKALTLGRALGPDAPEPLLRHLEGQRALVAYILGLAARGQRGAAAPFKR